MPVPGKRYHLRGPRAVLRGAAAEGGLDVVTLANNHTGDFGDLALLDTLTAAHAAGLQTVGAGASIVAAHRPAVLERGGLRVAFLGYSDVNPAGFPATASSPGTARADAVAGDVRRARRSADIVVCWFHWGVELHAEPDARQRALAAAALTAGAQVVLGAHPHVFGRVERLRRHALVAWTLGNFVFPSSGATARSVTGRTGALARQGGPPRATIECLPTLTNGSGLAPAVGHEESCLRTPARCRESSFQTATQAYRYRENTRSLDQSLDSEFHCHGRS